MIRALFVLSCCLSQSAFAEGLRFPSNATLQHETTAPVDDVQIAVGPWAEGTLPRQTFAGAVSQQAWHIRATGLTTLQLLRPLRAQLAQDGFEELFTCDTEDCGGFDFRFALDILGPPAMQVDLGDFRYLAATKGDSAVALVVSRSAQTGFVQLTTVGPAPTVTQSTTPQGVIADNADFTTRLERDGRVVLTGLSFETGSSRLSAGPFDDLQRLADYLAANTDRTVALVGHTDSAGSLDGNIALSKRRAGAVLERLVGDYGVPRRQLDAQGMGYLAPIANNATQKGRDANRRVEVIITSTQ